MFREKKLFINFQEYLNNFIHINLLQIYGLNNINQKVLNFSLW